MVYSYKTNKLILEHLEDTSNHTEKKKKKFYNLTIQR